MATKKKPVVSGIMKAAPKSGSGMLPWLGLALILVLLDQVVKIAVERSFHYGETVPVTGFFNLIKVYNPGAAFSFLGDAGGWQRYLFTGIAVVAVGYILYLLKRHPGQRLFCFALALIMGGAIGNVIDRMRYGAVVDFLDFHAFGYHWPAFNVADSAISIGVGLLLYDGLFENRRKIR